MCDTFTHRVVGSYSPPSLNGKVTTRTCEFVNCHFEIGIFLVGFLTRMPFLKIELHEVKQATRRNTLIINIKNSNQLYPTKTLSGFNLNL